MLRIFSLFLFLPFFFFTSVCFTSADNLDDIINAVGGETGEVTSADIPLPKISAEETAEKKTEHILYTVIKTILVLAGILAIVFVALGGVIYTISAANDDMMNRAKNMILYSLGGLIIIIFSYAILTNVVDFLEKSEAVAETAG